MNIADFQKTDGSFDAFLLAPGGKKIPQPTPFHTMLIIDCLRDVPATHAIRQRAVDYVLQQMQPDESWNYWERGSSRSSTQPYPNDLDDTACALVALHHYDPSLVSAATLGTFARHLVSAEHTVGGPYRTWLGAAAADQRWQQIDVAVNANIGYLLSQHNAVPAGLLDYVNQAIINDAYGSEFYVGEITTLYFIARWYCGPQLGRLRQKVVAALRGWPTLTQLEQAMLASCALRLGITPPKILHITAPQAHGLYVDADQAGNTLPCGSEALTLAFMLEAQHTQRAAVSKAGPVSDTSSPLINLQITDVQCRKVYQQMVGDVLRRAGGRQVSHAATCIAEANGWRVPASVLERLDAGSLHGWVAYTLYDDVLDNSGEVQLICVANMALRRSYQSFLNKDNSSYNKHVASVFDTIDSANYWEQSVRAQVDDGWLQCSRLPHYGNHNQLADRSLGHYVAAYGTFVHYLQSTSHPALDSLRLYYRHMLIARQLNDDAHDWQTDIAQGQLSTVVTALLRGYGFTGGALDLHEAMPDLQQYFWRTTIDIIAARIRRHITIAHRHLSDLRPYANITLFESWLDNLAAATNQALQSRDSALQFIAAFEETPASVKQTLS